MKNKNRFRFRFACLGWAWLLGFAAGVHAMPPDLTTANLALLDTVNNYSLGPTGLRGWMLSDASANQGALGRITAGSWQILVVAVGTNTPASGILASNDVILGLSTGAGTPVPVFTYSATNDFRKSFGWAIGAAEAGDGVLNLKRWRAGVTTDVALRLGLSNTAYSATSPYDCPKSAIILSNAGNIIANKSIAYDNGRENGYPGPPVLALALLASGNTNYLAKVRTYARTIAPANLSLTYAAPVGGGHPRGAGHSLDVWGWAYNGVFLAEYFLLTGDTNVLRGIQQFTLGLAQGQSRYGTMGHGCSLLDDQGNLHGTIPPYGPVNSCGLVANLAMALGRKAILAGGGGLDPEIDPALERAAKFFGYYVQKGNIPYGEHEPWYEHAGNGKESMTALLFAMIGDRPVETEYWTRLVMAGYNGREYGHTGQGFSYLWGAMAANVGGTNAAAAYLKEIRWHLDLSRRSDGSFVYDGSEQFGGSPTYDYWNTENYNSIDPTASYVLTYALAKQQLLLTGRNANPTNWLSSAKATNAIWAGAFDQVVAGLNTNQLVAALSEYDPLVRRLAAATLGTNASTSFSLLTNLASSPDPLLREAACQALGYLKNRAALPLLSERLTDSNSWVRAQAATALRNFAASASPQLTTMLMAFTNNATDPNVIVWEDPLQIANGFLGFELFGDAVYGGNNIASYTIAANTNLLYPAVRAGLKQPDSKSRLGASSFAYNRLSLAQVKALALDLFEVAATESQADVMWSMFPRADGIATLAKYHVTEAMPTALDMLITPPGFGWGNSSFLNGGLNALATYGDSARWTLPTLQRYRSTWDPTSGEFTTLVNAIASISSAVTPPVLTNLFAVANSQVVVTTNAKAITLAGFSWRTATVSFTNVTAPAHGTLTGTAPNLTYTPTGGYTGLDSFTFQVSDGVSNSPTATVSLIVGTPAGNGLKGEYFDNADFTALKFSRTDPQVNFDWGTGSPSNTIAADTFGVRWSGLLLAPETASYLFSTLNSDGVRLYVNGVPVIDDFVDHTTRWNDGTPIALTAGQSYEVQMDYYENTGSAVAKLKWTGPSFAGSNGVLIGREWLFDGSGVSNRAAIAYPQSVTMLQNTTRAIALSGAGNPPGYAIVTPPVNGALTGTPPNMTYTPATNFSGTDSFTFLVNNDLSNSAPATVSIGVWAGLPVSFFWKSAVSSNWSVAANWTNAAGAAGAPDAAGQPFYTLNFNRSGTYTVTNDLNDEFLLNQLNVAGTVTFAGASAPAFTGNGPLLPQINQNSASAVTFDGPLTLSAMTVVGGSGGGQVTIPSLISGPGGLTKNSSGSLEIYGLSANTYSGGTIVNSGTLHWGTITNGISPPCNFAAGTGLVTLGDGATLEFDRVNATNALILNGGTMHSANGWGVNWNGPVTLNSNATIQTSYNMSFGGNISGAGGFIKTGPNTLTLSGTNNFTGANFITAGTFTCTKSVSVGSGAWTISDGAVVNLSYTGTRQIAALSLGGTNQPAGSYGATNSPATTRDKHFTGTGTVTVVAVPGSLTNSPAAVIQGTSALLRATLVCNGTYYAVHAFWNTINCGTNAMLWTNSGTIRAPRTGRTRRTTRC